MSGVSDPFLSALHNLLAAFEEVEDRWSDFRSRYEEARRQRGVWFPDLSPKWGAFQSAFREAAQQTMECRKAMPKPEELPRLWTGWPPGWAIADTFPELLKLFSQRLGEWLPGVMNPEGGFAAWDWNTDFSREFMEQFQLLFIVPLQEAIKVYEKFLAQQEAQGLAAMLLSEEIATGRPSVPHLPGAEESSPAPQGPGGPQGGSAGGEDAVAKPEVNAPTQSTVREGAVDAGAVVLALYTGHVANETFRKLAEIVRDTTLTVNEKLARLHATLPLPPNVSAQKLAKALGVSKSAVIASDWWKEHRKGRREKDQERRRERLIERGKQYEPPPRDD